MFLIVGLGNIGEKYEFTRHNIGFMVLDKFCKKHQISFDKKNNSSIYGTGFVCNKKVICIKPKTFMNLSGEAVCEIVEYFKIKLEDILIIYDDIYLDFLKIKVREVGGHGGHNGIRNIIDRIGIKNFKRIRVGIGENKNINLSDYVLSKFSSDELNLFEKRCDDILNCIEIIIEGNIVRAMNTFN